MQPDSHPKTAGRAFLSLFIQQIERRGAQKAIADAVGMDPSELSRFKNEDMKRLFEVVAAAGLRVVLEDEKTYPQQVVDALLVLAKHNLQGAENADHLITPR